MIARLISASIGLVLLSSAFRWTLDPESAAAGLAMALVEGPGDTTMGMNTQIGDFTAFLFYRRPDGLHRRIQKSTCLVIYNIKSVGFCCIF